MSILKSVSLAESKNNQHFIIKLIRNSDLKFRGFLPVPGLKIFLMNFMSNDILSWERNDKKLQVEVAISSRNMECQMLLSHQLTRCKPQIFCQLASLKCLTLTFFFSHWKRIQTQIRKIWNGWPNMAFPVFGKNVSIFIQLSQVT